MVNLPTHISFFFALTTVATILLIWWAMQGSHLETTRQKSTAIMAGLAGWALIQAVLTVNGLYRSTVNAIPPKILLFGILPPLLTIVALFATPKGKKFIDSLPLTKLTYLNVIRIPVEVVLFWLFIHGAVPKLMTFEGRNFDIIAGITAPLMAYFGLTKGKLNRQVMLAWNFVCLILLLNIVVNAFLSAPSPLQQFGFEQPNWALLNFPFSWLPTCIVPIVLFGHLTSIRQLINSKSVDRKIATYSWR